MPGSRPEWFEKAANSRADALSFDLEDAVVQDRKVEARARVASFLRIRNGVNGKVAIVRVNAISSGLFGPDVEAVVGPGLDIINLPKVESGGDIRAAVDAIAKAERRSGLNKEIVILANIETPKGLRLAAEIAAGDPRVAGLQIGFVDFASRCGIDSRDKTALQAVRLAVRFAAAEAGIAAFDGAFVDLHNAEALRAEAEDARRLGFMGKSCIHPTQIPVVNEVFSPRADEIAHAERVLSAAAEAAKRGAGAFVLEGRMVDNPIILQARVVVELAAKLGIPSGKQGI